MANKGNVSLRRHARGAQIYISSRVYDDSQNPIRGESDLVAEIIPGRGIMIRRRKEGE